jgi:hypothetical protein
VKKPKPNGVWVRVLFYHPNPLSFRVVISGAGLGCVKLAPVDTRCHPYLYMTKTFGQRNIKLYAKLHFEVSKVFF